MKTRKLLITTLLLLPVAIQAEDWPCFRGPEGNGFSVENKIPTELNKAWKVALPGRGLSSPITIGNMVFVTASSGNIQDRLHVFCFDGDKGATLWERQFWSTGRTMSHKKTNIAAPTPVSDGRYIYALFSCNDLVCLDLEGNLKWLRGLTSDYPNASNSLGMASSLLVTGKTLIVQIENDSQPLAIGIDINNGSNRWKIPRPKSANWTTANLLPGAGKGGNTLVALQSKDGIHAVDPANGKTQWAYKGGASTIPSSTRMGKVLLVPSHGLTAIKPRHDGSTYTQLWRVTKLRPATASPTIANGKIYNINGAGVLSCVNPEEGKTLWQLRLKGPFSGSPVAAGKHLYYFNEAGLGQVIDSGGAEGKIVGKVDLGETILSTPAISNGALFVRSDEHLWKLN
jgi:outer membrane protein assembly factor BamB